MGAPRPDADLGITSITDEGSGAPTAEVNQPFSVGVEARDESGNLYLVKKDTKVTLSLFGGALTGNTTGTIARGDSSTTITGVIATAAGNFTLCASGFKLATGCSLLSVQETLETFVGTPGAPLAVSTCTEATPGNKCVLVEFPNGTDGFGFVTQTSCAGFPGAEVFGACLTEDSLITIIADFKAGTGALVTRDNPAVVTVLCDKEDCKEQGEPTNGVPFWNVYVQVNDGEQFVLSPDCVHKGVVNPEPDPPFCTDKVSSTRTAEGDLALVELIAIDWRMR